MRVGRLRMRVRPRTILTWLLLGLFARFCYKFVFPVHIDIKAGGFNDHTKCPACFGESLCPDLYHGELTLTNWTRYTIATLFNNKNVFFGKLHGRDVIIKKLGHDSELGSLDVTICNAAGQKPGFCHPGHYIKYLTSTFRVSSSLDSTRRGSLDYSQLNRFDWTESLSCIRTQRLVDILFARARLHLSSTALEHVLTLLALNPEPLIFMTFPASEGWPFPEYMGACGRLAVFQHGGTMLTKFADESWINRLEMAKQLLQMAMKFTSNDLDIALYLTDWSSDNFAVDSSGRLRVIDGESFILVDQKDTTPTSSWNTPHTTTLEGVGCKDRFCYASEDLCTHRVSDHNLYGVCKGLLAPEPFSPGLAPKGLLHSVPGEVLRKQPLLPRMLQECNSPSHPGGRFEAAKELLEILKAV